MSSISRRCTGSSFHSLPVKLLSTRCFFRERGRRHVELGAKILRHRWHVGRQHLERELNLHIEEMAAFDVADTRCCYDTVLVGDGPGAEVWRYS